MTTPQWALDIIGKTKEHNLVILDLERPSENTALSRIPGEIFEILHLEELTLSYNGLTSLPESIARLNQLTSLDLSYNQFTDLPKSITELHNLSVLNLNANFLTDLSESISKLSNLSILNLSYNELTDLPESLKTLKNLRVLDLSNNSLNSLPEYITKLQNLRTLNLTSNGLRRIPKTIDDLQDLTNLDLSSNRLTELPELFAKLQNLTTLNLSNNEFTSLPECITKLQNLTTLNLSNNKLTTLPESITKLQNLARLNLSNNKLTTLPESIDRLQNLKTLILTENRLAGLPESIAKLDDLTELILGSNPMINPPPEVADRGIEAIRDYFRQLREVGQDKLYEAKLLILGEGGAGKTSLAKKIEDSNYQLQEKESSTEGIDVIQWSFPLDESKSFRINIWDFGGQEIYHATHQFFLTKRSLYILVSDTRKEDTDFYYWLNVIELLSDNSPLIIVKNEKHERQKEINERQLRGQFDNLKEVLSTNLATNRGLNEIIDEIRHLIQRLPHVGTPLPTTWVRVREALEEDERNYIRLDEYLEICVKNGFSEIRDGMQLSGYLHDMGVFLHFQDDTLLKKTVILKPKWGTDAVYKVLDNREVIRNLGKFTRADLKDIWNAPEDEGMHDELLQLMMKFKLCYEIPNQKGVYIAPQLLTESQPDYEWDENDNLLLRYTYEFMPKGILTQFIVVMHAFIREQKVVWKSGIVLIKDKTHAEVIEHYGRREIRVRIVGAHKKELMTIVMHELDQIHSTYKRLKYDKLIPCNCEECQNNAEPHFFKYEQLQNFIEKRLLEIQCGSTGNMVNVRGLIDDILKREYIRELSESPMAQYIIHGDYIDQGEKKMTDNKVSISNSTVHGSVIAAESIKDSFNVIENANIKDDLKEQLRLLTQAVETMLKELPKERVKEVAKDMKLLANEATKENPNSSWYNVSIEGLIAAAQNLGKVGEPVIELSRKVLSLLTG
jgi:internalin A